ncbi:hydrolase [Streptomyces sp. NPDC018964]|uniref:hydrolase n=1 Tax=unclassified Streptomyces TaxID=2593676 RepID=UPI0037B5D521
MPASFSVPPSRDFDAVIFAYTGVIGLAPTPGQWARLAGLAGWRRSEIGAFKRQYRQWLPRYQENLIGTKEFWTVLMHPEQEAGLDSELLAALRNADTDMWTSTGPGVTAVLRSTHTAGTPVALLADVPWPVADAIEGTEWRATLITRTVFSSRTGVTSPAARAFDAACVAVRARPEHTLYVDRSRRNLDAAAHFGLKVLHSTGDPAGLAGRLPEGPADDAVTTRRPSSPAPLASVTRQPRRRGPRHAVEARTAAQVHRRTDVSPRDRAIRLQKTEQPTRHPA